MLANIKRGTAVAALELLDLVQTANCVHILSYKDKQTITNAVTVACTLWRRCLMIRSHLGTLPLLTDY